MKNATRHIRQIPLIGVSGQDKLRNSTVAVVGVGGLGSVASEILVRSGVGKLILIDEDKIELSNLQRQSLYQEKDVGESKVLVAKKHLKEIDSNAIIEVKNVRLTEENISEHIEEPVNLILDCTDNMETRWLLNDYVCKKSLPWIFTSVAGWSGMLRLILPNSICFKCQMPENAKGYICNEIGVMASSTQVIGAMQANLALRYLLGRDIDEFTNNLILVDLQEIKIRKFLVKKKLNCEIC